MFYVLDDTFILLVFEIKLLKSWLLLFLLPSWKRHPADCNVTLGGGCRENCHSARHRGHVSESKSSDEISSSNESLSTDAGQLSLKPYMHEPPATPSTLRKVDKSQHTLGDGYLSTHSTVTQSAPSDERHQRQHAFVTFHCRHIVSDGFINLCMPNCLADNISI